MLQIRPICENCGNHLPPDSAEAMICSFECTFCSGCVSNILQNVCPNCGGGFEKRPVRPKEKLLKSPATTENIFKPVAMNSFQSLLIKNKDIPPQER